MAIDGKYGVITTEKKQLHPNEPVFLLRATDKLAPAAIRMYGVVCQGKGCDKDHLDAIERHAQRIEAWQAANPNLVKKPD